MTSDLTYDRPSEDVVRRTASGESFLSTKALYKVYRRGAQIVRALDNINFACNRGSFVTIIGRSGCGKSTFLRLLGGLLRPSAGHILLDGEAIVEPPAKARFVFQDYAQSLLPWKTVEENVRFGILNGCAANPARRYAQLEEARRTLERVGLAHAFTRYPWELSGGMQQRVAIARALASRPELLLMDEPFSSVDAQSRAQLQEMLLTAWSQLCNTIVFVTHDIDEAVYLSDRVVVLDAHGKGICADIDIKSKRPRDPLATREGAEYLQARRELFELVMG